MAQVMAREDAVLRGARSAEDILMAGVHAAEQVVIENLRRKMATAEENRDGTRARRE